MLSSQLPPKFPSNWAINGLGGGVSILREAIVNMAGTLPSPHWSTFLIRESFFNLNNKCQEIKEEFNS